MSCATYAVLLQLWCACSSSAQVLQVVVLINLVEQTRNDHEYCSLAAFWLLSRVVPWPITNMNRVGACFVEGILSLANGNIYSLMSGRTEPVISSCRCLYLAARFGALVIRMHVGFRT
ncbi:hypothetical protein F4860DRAFT_448582 [Xylaria cubensis]|nr:hypothetical protein F4860DRAFT_448582 [Xylaria cubensis]